MKTVSRRILAILLCCLCLLPGIPAYAAQAEGFRCQKTAEPQPDGSVRISLEALQTGRVAATDVVLVLDVSASMEHNTVVPVQSIDGTKTYYILYEYYYWGDDREVLRREYVPVQNTASAGETPVWYASLPDEEGPVQIDPSTTAFYTGAMEALRAAAAEFIQSVADNAASYDADHRIAVVEFSARDAKGADALCTHDNNKHIPFYANILSGDGTASGALVSARSSVGELKTIAESLHGDGATYSDDAMTQAKNILAASERENRIVILFTDGGPGSYGWTDDLDSSALPTANGAIAAAAQMKAQGVQIFTVGAFNESDLSSAVGVKNTNYLNYISSNYPDAQSMTEAGQKAANGYCSIGRTDMNLRAAFASISEVIGVPIHSACVQDVVSADFYLTDAQRQALLTAYPTATITDNNDGTTSIILENVDFPAVPVRADGSPVDPDDDGIFSMTFSVTPRDTFLGGKNVATNTGLCGVLTDGVLLATFDVPQIDVPINENVLQNLFSVRALTVYAGDTLSAEDLYEDLSDSDVVRYTDGVTFAVTDETGAPFTGGVLDASRTFTVTAVVRMGDETVSVSKTVSVTVRENAVAQLELVSLPTKTNYFVGDTLSLEGISVAARMTNGKTVRLTADDLTASPDVFGKAGEQTVTVSFAGVSQTFTITVKTVEPVSAKVIAQPQNNAYVYRTAPDFSGLAVEITYNNGATEVVRDLSAMTIRAQSDARIRRGTQTFTVSTRGVHASFTMRVRLVWWQWLILILLFGWIWY